MTVKLPRVPRVREAGVPIPARPNLTRSTSKINCFVQLHGMVRHEKTSKDNEGLDGWIEY